MTKLQLIWAAVRYRPTRSVASALGIAIAVSTFVFAVAAREQLAAATSSRLPARVLVFPALAQELPLAMGEKLSKVPGVSDVQYQYLDLVHDRRTNRDSLRLWAISDGYVETRPPNAVRVSEADHARWLAEKTGLLVDPSTAAYLGWHLGDHIDWDTGREHVAGVVCGFTTGTFLGVILHYSYYALLEGKPMPPRVFSVGCERADCDALAQRVDDFFDHEEVPTLSVTLEQEVASVTKRISALPTLLMIVGGTLFLVTLVISATNLAMALRERSDEWSTLYSLGFGRGQIFRLIVAESTLVSALGGVLGGAAVYVGTQVVDWHLGSEMMSNQALHVSPELALLGLSLSLVAGVFIAVVPAVVMLRMVVNERSRD